LVAFHIYDIKLKLKMKKESFLKWNNRVLAEAFKRPLYTTMLSALADFLFYAASFFAFSLWYQRIMEKMYSLSIPGPSELASMGQAAREAALGEARSFYIAVILSLILLVVFAIFLFSIASALSWSLAAGKKQNLHLFSRFLALDMAWAPGWVILIALAAMYAQPGYVFAFMVAIAFAAYFLTTMLHSAFIDEEKLRSVKTAFRLGFGKIRLYALPFASFFSILYIVMVLAGALKFSYSSYLYSAILLLCAAFYRSYFYRITSSIRKENL
jgi:hypothetical protein